jgi:hypothetical protein
VKVVKTGSAVNMVEGLDFSPGSYSTLPAQFSFAEMGEDFCPLEPFNA